MPRPKPSSYICTICSKSFQEQNQIAYHLRTICKPKHMDTLLKQIIIIHPISMETLRKMMVDQPFTLEQFKAQCERREREESEKVRNSNIILTLFFFNIISLILSHRLRRSSDQLMQNLPNFSPSRLRYWQD